MPKFSIIIPVYNSQEYLKTCIESVLKQGYEDYEVILVNDGSTDTSVNIIDEYCFKRDNFKKISTENRGLSSARNTGVENARGEYILFIDSDDFIENGLLEKLDCDTYDQPDVVRFQVRECNGEKKLEYKEEPFEILEGYLAFEKIAKYHFVENAWCYLYKRSFYTENNFYFAVGRVHEDFGLTPLIIMVAKKVKSIDFVGYNYVIRQNSIMTNKDYKKVKIKVDDFLYHYKTLIEKIDDYDVAKKDVFKSFLANSLIIKSLELRGTDYKEFLKNLRELKVFDNLLADTFSRRVKRFLLRFSPRLYYKVIK